MWDGGIRHSCSVLGVLNPLSLGKKNDKEQASNCIDNNRDNSFKDSIPDRNAGKYQANYVRFLELFILATTGTVG
jgi:hypothetical protein